MLVWITGSSSLAGRCGGIGEHGQTNVGRRGGQRREDKPEGTLAPPLAGAGARGKSGCKTPFGCGQPSGPFCHRVSMHGGALSVEACRTLATARAKVQPRVVCGGQRVGAALKWSSAEAGGVTVSEQQPFEGGQSERAGRGEQRARRLRDEDCGAADQLAVVQVAQRRNHTLACTEERASCTALQHCMDSMRSAMVVVMMMMR